MLLKCGLYKRSWWRRRLVKAGVIPQQYARRFNLISAWGELVSYVGSIWLNTLRIAAALERERALSDELLRRKKVHSPCNWRVPCMQCTDRARDRPRQANGGRHACRGDPQIHTNW